MNTFETVSRLVSGPNNGLAMLRSLAVKMMRLAVQGWQHASLLIRGSGLTGRVLANAVLTMLSPPAGVTAATGAVKKVADWAMRGSRVVGEASRWVWDTSVHVVLDPIGIVSPAAVDRGYRVISGVRSAASRVRAKIGRGMRRFARGVGRAARSAKVASVASAAASMAPAVTFVVGGSSLWPAVGFVAAAVLAALLAVYVRQQIAARRQRTGNVSKPTGEQQADGFDETEPAPRADAAHDEVIVSDLDVDLAAVPQEIAEDEVHSDPVDEPVTADTEAVEPTAAESSPASNAGLDTAPSIPVWDPSELTAQDWSDIAAGITVEVTPRGAVVVHGVPERLTDAGQQLVAEIAANAAIGQLRRTIKARPTPSRDDKRLFTKAARDALRRRGHGTDRSQAA